jgi:serine protease Do
MNGRKLTSALLAIALAWPVAAASAETFKNETELVKAVMPSFVNIYNRGVAASTKADGTKGAPRIQDEVGSGFIVDPSGVIVTNRHVIEGAYALFVTLSDGTHVPAKLIGKALSFDIALIKIDVGRPLQPAKIGDSDKLQIGDHVVAIGNPLGWAGSVSSGIISAFHRQVGLSSYDNLMQTDATINQGNSGGPLFNMDGEVIGINQAIYTQNHGGSIGIGFSIPVNEAKYLLTNVKQYGTPRIGWLGVTAQTFTAAMGRISGKPEQRGAIVSALADGGAAAAGGLRVGDIITKIGEDKIEGTSSLNRAVATLADKTAPVTIIRDGQTTSIPIKVLQWPQELWSSKLADRPVIKSLDDLGLTFSQTAGPDGPVVGAVEEGSIGWVAGVRAGDIIRKVDAAAPRSVDDLAKILHDQIASGRGGALVLLGGPNGERWVEFSGLE